MVSFDYAHMDVFTARSLSGNGLAVVFEDRPVARLTEEQMLSLAREFRQFETIFLSGAKTVGINTLHVGARIFTMDEELPFAGHPILGGCAALHARLLPEAEQASITVCLPEKKVEVTCQQRPHGAFARMCQGKPAFLGTLSSKEAAWMAEAHDLSERDLAPGLPVEIVSTGLPYVLLPVRSGLEKARIVTRELGARLASLGAAFVYLFDPQTLEARTWDVLGLVEDAATGSAAGPTCAYLMRHGLAGKNETVTIRQGRFAHHPSVLYAEQQGEDIYVSGDVVCFAKGRFQIESV